MGFGVSGILGAKLAAPDRVCVSICGDGGFTMTPHVLCTAVEYDIPCIWLIWNNFAWGAIRDIQYGLFDGREHRHRVLQRREPRAVQSRFRGAGARARCGRRDDQAHRRPGPGAGGGDRGEQPCVLDVHVDADVRPPATGTWALPPIPHKEPVFGKPLILEPAGD